MKIVVVGKIPLFVGSHSGIVSKMINRLGYVMTCDIGKTRVHRCCVEWKKEPWKKEQHLHRPMW